MSARFLRHSTPSQLFLFSSHISHVPHSELRLVLVGLSFLYCDVFILLGPCIFHRFFLPFFLPAFLCKSQYLCSPPIFGIFVVIHLFFHLFVLAFLHFPSLSLAWLSFPCFLRPFFLFYRLPFCLLIPLSCWGRLSVLDSSAKVSCK